MKTILVLLSFLVLYSCDLNEKRTIEIEKKETKNQIKTDSIRNIEIRDIENKNLNETDSIKKLELETKGNENQIITDSKRVDNEYLISNQSVGKYRIGDSVPRIGENVSFENRLETSDEGHYNQPVFVVKQDNIEILNILPEFDFATKSYSKKIGEIIILSDKFKDSKGIGINSTLDQFIEKYNEYSLWYTYISDRFIIENKNNHIQFLLENSDFQGTVKYNSDMEILKRNDFKIDTRIKTIRIY